MEALSHSPKHKSMSDEWPLVTNPSMHVHTKYKPHMHMNMHTQTDNARTQSHLSLILVQWRMVWRAQMCMQSRRRSRMRERRVSSVYLWLGGCTHRSPIQDHGHLGGLVDIAAERRTGPGTGVTVMLPSTTTAPQAWHGYTQKRGGQRSLTAV